MINDEITLATYESLIGPSIMDSNLSIDLVTNRFNPIGSIVNEELNLCEEFIFIVAFVTINGLNVIKDKLKNKPGIIITGNYLNFTEPEALEQLLLLDNIKVYVDMSNNLHSKGYFFKRENYWSLLIGSANITYSALNINSESLIKLPSLDTGALYKQIMDEVATMKRNAKLLSDETIAEYKIKYDNYTHKTSDLFDYLSFVNSNTFEKIVSISTDNDIISKIDFVPRTKIYNEFNTILGVNFVHYYNILKQFIFGLEYDVKNILSHSEIFDEINLEKIKDLIDMLVASNIIILSSSKDREKYKYVGSEEMKKIITMINRKELEYGRYK